MRPTYRGTTSYDIPAEEAASALCAVMFRFLYRVCCCCCSRESKGLWRGVGERSLINLNV